MMHRATINLCQRVAFRGIIVKFLSSSQLESKSGLLLVLQCYNPLESHSGIQLRQQSGYQLELQNGILLMSYSCIPREPVGVEM